MSSSELEIQQKPTDNMQEQTPNAEINAVKHDSVPEAVDKDFAAAEQYKNKGNDLLKSKLTFITYTSHYYICCKVHESH